MNKFSNFVKSSTFKADEPQQKKIKDDEISDIDSKDLNEETQTIFDESFTQNP